MIVFVVIVFSPPLARTRMKCFLLPILLVVVGGVELTSSDKVVCRSVQDNLRSSASLCPPSFSCVAGFCEMSTIPKFPILSVLEWRYLGEKKPINALWIVLGVIGAVGLVTAAYLANKANGRSR